eukprot:Phypoly_transcript_13240.p1 GENE.Phypoly_transcript_13240~~Phypoly_transcript_13240.p1  ORF type:complete len:142 (+),score=16.40 Phypoly_transcript_13240:602-1027(+)
MSYHIHEERDWPLSGVEDEEDIDEEDPVVAFWPNHAEITRRQGAGILGAPAGGAPDRTWQAILNEITRHTIGLPINAEKHIYKFASPITWAQAQQGVRGLRDGTGQDWTRRVDGFPPVCEAWSVFPKSTVKVQNYFAAFPE